jgi:hypothetical protein
MLRGSFVAAVAVVLALAPGVRAEEDYNRKPVEVEGVEFTRPAAAPTAFAQEEDDPDRIPITGGDVAGLTAMGLGSIAAGMALTRRARRHA